jgi:hypothetical protein
MKTPLLPTVLITAALLALTSAPAHADGYVLRVDGDQVYVDLGAADGVGAGTRLTLFHVILVTHPTTGKKLRDRFALGELTVLRAGEHLAVAQAPPELAPRVRPGDEIGLAGIAAPYLDPWQEHVAERRSRRAAARMAPRPGPAATLAPVPAPAAPSENVAEREARRARGEADAVLAAWRETLGKPPEARVAIWQEYVKAHPQSPYAAVATRELVSLHEQRGEAERLAVQRATRAETSEPGRADRLAAIEPALDLDTPLAARPPDKVYDGTRVELAFAVLRPDRAERGWLYYRQRGARAYQRSELRADGDAYLRGAIPAAAVQPPGLEYFVEIAGSAPGETPRAGFGAQQAPRRIAVERRVEDEPNIRDRSRITLFTDYVDFDGGLASGFDQYYHAEIDFAYRFERPVYAVRAGFGTLEGTGGPKDEIDESPTGDCRDADGVYRCRRVSYNYAYAEVEHRFSPTVAVIVRPQLGYGARDVLAGAGAGRCAVGEPEGCDSFRALGLRARLRIGDERETNLTLGLGLTQNVGTLFEASYAWSAIPRFPIKLAAQVTDQPVPEDFGVRILADVGWRAVRWVYPSLRLSYQARDVDHSGVSGGVAANFDW